MPRQILSPEKIIQASVDIIEANKPISFTSVSQNLGTRSQSLYSYFANQTALEYAIVARAVQNVNEHLQEDVFGRSGQGGLIELAMSMRTIGLNHPALSRFVFSMPRTNDFPAVNEAYEKFEKLLMQMVAGAYHKKKTQYMVSRFLRDLLVGEIVNVGTGWFTNPVVSADQSFLTTLKMNLELFAKTE